MGLDMHLLRVVRTRGKVTISPPKEWLRMEAVGAVVEEVGYWRNRRWLHNWFVRTLGAEIPHTVWECVDRKTLEKMERSLDIDWNDPARFEELTGASLHDVFWPSVQDALIILCRAVAYRGEECFIYHATG